MRNDLSGEQQARASEPADAGPRPSEQVSTTSLTSILAMATVLSFAVIIIAGLVLILS